MNQLLYPIIYTVGAAYATRTISDYIVSAAINKTTDVVVFSAKSTWNYVTNKDSKELKPEYDFEYEYVDVNNDDKIIYVNSHIKNIDDSWDPIEIELKVLDKKERIRKKCVMSSPILSPISGPSTSPSTGPSTGPSGGPSSNGMKILEI
jgi:hypothetical protein